MPDHHQHFLDAESALDTVLEELKNLKSATSQIEKAENVSQSVIRASEEICQKMAKVLSASEALVEYLDRSQLTENLKKISDQGSIAQTTAEQILGNLNQLHGQNQVFQNALDQFSLAQNELTKEIKQRTEEQQLKIEQNFLEEKGWVENLTKSILLNRRLEIIFGVIITIGLLTNIVLQLVFR